MVTNAIQGTLNPHTDIYERVLPKDNIFRRLREEIDWSFVYDELKSKYCPDNGRMAVSPVLLFKILVLKSMSDLSDKDLEAEVNVNLAWKYFLGMHPDELSPDASTFCKFRKQRLKDAGIMDVLLGKTLELAVEKGILRKNAKDGRVHVSIIVDGTHTESANGFHHPVPALKAYSSRLRKALYKYDESLRGQLPTDKDFTVKELRGEVDYVRGLLKLVREELPHLAVLPDVARASNRLEELLNDALDHFAVSADDSDARLGHKSADTAFFGYKTQIAIDEESCLALGAKVTSGEVNDALPGLELVKEIAQSPALKVREMIADAAYSGQPFLALASSAAPGGGFEVIAPPHPGLGRSIDGRDGFTFNKDADMFCCPQGHLAISRRVVTYKNDNNRRAAIYAYDPDHCSICPRRGSCLKGPKAKARTFSVSMPTPEQKDLLRRQHTERFKARRRERYKIERANAHLKASFGLGVTNGKGLEAMTLQAAVALFAYNLRIILRRK